MRVSGVRSVRHCTHLRVMVCSADGCDLFPKVRGMCQRHYSSAYKRGEIPIKRRAKRHTKPRIRVRTNGCWDWGGAVLRGRGVVGDKGKNLLAYRWVWQAMRGPIAEGHQLHHVCRNRLCVNPDHLQEMAPVEHRSAHWSPVT